MPSGPVAVFHLRRRGFASEACIQRCRFADIRSRCHGGHGRRCRAVCAPLADAYAVVDLACLHKNACNGNARKAECAVITPGHCSLCPRSCFAAARRRGRRRRRFPIVSGRIRLLPRWRGDGPRRQPQSRSTSPLDAPQGPATNLLAQKQHARLARSPSSTVAKTQDHRRRLSRGNSLQARALASSPTREENRDRIPLPSCRPEALRPSVRSLSGKPIQSSLSGRPIQSSLSGNPLL